MKPSPSGCFIALVTVPLTLSGLALLIGAMLKETPIFWRNVGGYPAELRELVLDCFYPACGIYFICLVLGSSATLRLANLGVRAGAVLLLALVLNWMLFAAIATTVIWNNMENLLDGRPLHYHSP